MDEKDQMKFNVLKFSKK